MSNLDTDCINMLLEQAKTILEKNYPELQFSIQSSKYLVYLCVQWYDLSDLFDYERRYEIVRHTAILNHVENAEEVFAPYKGINALQEYLRYAIDSMRIIFQNGCSIVECDMSDYVSYKFIPKTVEELLDKENT